MIFQKYGLKKCAPKNVNKHPLMDIIRHLYTVLVSTDCEETESIKKKLKFGKNFFFNFTHPQGWSNVPPNLSPGGT